MRKWSVLCFFAVAALTAGLFACGFSTVGESNEPDCKYVLKKHAKSIAWHLSLTCKYQEKCEANVAYIGVLELGLDSIQCYDHSEYKFDDGKTKKTVKMNTTVPVTVDDDDHVRFSLFDSEKVEKTYDIDLSEIIHSYTVKDDSVEINVAYFNKVHLYTNGDIVELENMELENGRYSFGVNDGYKSDIYFVKNLNKQSSMRADSIHVYGDLYWR